MSRDFVRKEKKKPKKDAKKPEVSTQLTQAVEVEVVRKRRKKEEEPDQG